MTPLICIGWEFIQYMNNYQSDSKFRYASKYFGISLTYNFGGKQSHERNESTMDEANRIK